jgi:hypothetical protein
MKDALLTAALVVFTVIMLLVPALWEPVSEAEAREVFDNQ